MVDCRSVTIRPRSSSSSDKTIPIQSAFSQHTRSVRFVLSKLDTRNGPPSILSICLHTCFLCRLPRQAGRQVLLSVKGGCWSPAKSSTRCALLERPTLTKVPAIRRRWKSAPIHTTTTSSATSSRGQQRCCCCFWPFSPKNPPMLLLRWSKKWATCTILVLDARSHDSITVFLSYQLRDTQPLSFAVSPLSPGGVKQYYQRDRQHDHYIKVSRWRYSSKFYFGGFFEGLITPSRD